jgi:hypothetical protein
LSSAQKEWLHRLTVAIFLGFFILLSASHLGESSRSDDEGINLMKARMAREGYLLHRDIWSDQPPFFTLCLTAVFDLFGESVPVARGLIVAFACLALISTVWIARLLGGRTSSLAALTFLAFSPQFPELSRSVMIGLPAHALAALAMVCGLMALRTDREVWLVGAGLSLSASLLTKPLQPFLFVPLAIILWIQSKDRPGSPWPRRRRKLQLLAIATVVPLLVAASLFGGPHLVQQVVGSYLRGQQSQAFQLGRLISRSVDYVLEGGLLYWAGILIALYGFGITWHQRNGQGIAVSAWLLSGLVAIYSQTRFRERYLLFLSFPLAGLLSIGLRDIVCRARLAQLRPRRWGSLAVGAAVIISLVLGTAAKVRSLLSEPYDLSLPEEEAVIMLKSMFTPGSYVISDDGMLPFRAGLLTPPELTAISTRRVRTGQLTAEAMIEASQKYRPHAIILWEKRLAALPEYVDWVKQHYCLARGWGSSQHIYTSCEILQPCDGCLMRLGDSFGIAQWSLAVSGVSGRVASAGDTISVTLHWQSLQPTEVDYHIFCHLGEEALLTQWDGRPRQGEYPTYRWLQGEEVIDRYALHVPSDAPAGYYPLWVGMYDWDSSSRLPVMDPQGQYVGSAALLTYVRVGTPEFETPFIPQPHEASLGDQVRFLGYDLPSVGVRAGDVATLTLYWQCVQDMDTDYTVFVHVVNPEGDIVGQWDSTPQRGELPTTTWVPGEIVVDAYQIPIATDASAGNLAVRVGMYDAQSGQRLLVTDSDGNRLMGDQIELGALRIGRQPDDAPGQI